MYKDYEELIKKRITSNPIKKRVAVVCADDNHTLSAVIMAYEQDLITPILIGNKSGIKEKLMQLECNNEMEIINSMSYEDAVTHMLKLFHDNQCDVIMKGKIDTSILMRAVVKKENGLNEENIISSVVLMEVPNYHKMILFTDAGIVMYPTLQQKKELIINAVRFMRSIGYDCPKVAILCSVEKVNPKMQETLDAVILTRMAEDGEFGRCKVYGPLSYDLVVNKEVAEIKGVDSLVAGDADVVLVPDINTGNAVTKSITHTAGGSGGSVILGAKIPIIFSSRGSTKIDKYESIALACSAYKENI